MAIWEIFVATAVVRYTAAAISDRGRKRGSNEDAFGYSVEHGVYLVCDGMGGAAAGEIASSLAIEEALRLITEKREAAHSGPSPLPADSIPGIAEAAVVAANQAIHTRSQRNQKLSGMGTTLVGLLTSETGETSEEQAESDPRVWILNVGDSRCYRLRRHRLEQCTRDHSVVEEQVRLGRMTREEAHRSPLRNLITRVIGTQSSVTPDIVEVDAEPGDLFLLCSDGLTTELADSKIESLLNTAASAGLPLEEHCHRLIQAANKAGGHDNITCLLVRVD
jgi:serine/threonine protein phosphatase PrpC